MDQIPRKGNMKILTGLMFGRLTVERLGGFTPTRRALWFCRCECGGTKTVLGSSLLNGNTKSCGCILSEVMKKKMTTHGGSKTRVYRIWTGMLNRCYRVDDYHYPRWGGRGIKVCEEWRDFETFRDWALSNGYKENLSIERTDNDDWYCPGNCTWATNKKQANNRRSNRLLTFNGETRTIAEWGDVTGLGDTAIRLRIDRRGWSVQRALTQKLRITSMPREAI